MNALSGRAALIHRVCLLGGALLLASACERESTVTRLQAIADTEVTPTAVAEKIDGELSPRLLRRFSPLPKAPDGLDSHRQNIVQFLPPAYAVRCDACTLLDRRRR
jgi:hypothetical protein